jgi:DNA-binding transcriptional MerR regulator
MPTEYSLVDLAKLADVTPRTIRFYIAQGLLAAPTTGGSAARYGESHLARLRLIKRLQLTHLPLADIRQRLRGLTEDQIEAIGEALGEQTRSQASTGSALDYIRGVLGARPAQVVAESSPPRYAPVAAQSASTPAAAAITPAAAASSPTAVSSMRDPVAMVPAPSPAPMTAPAPPPSLPSTAETDRSQWERISLDPDVELHIRRPLTRQQNKRVERLITIARQLLEED